MLLIASCEPNCGRRAPRDGLRENVGTGERIARLDDGSLAQERGQAVWWQMVHREGFVTSIAEQQQSTGTFASHSLPSEDLQARNLRAFTATDLRPPAVIFRKWRSLP